MVVRLREWLRRIWRHLHDDEIFWILALLFVIGLTIWWLSSR